MTAQLTAQIKLERANQWVSVHSLLSFGKSYAATATDVRDTRQVMGVSIDRQAESGTHGLTGHRIEFFTHSQNES